MPAKMSVPYKQLIERFKRDGLIESSTFAFERILEMPELYPYYYYYTGITDESDLIEVLEKDGDIVIYERNSNITISQSNTIRPNNEWFTNIEQTYDINPSFVGKINEVYLVGDYCVAITDSDRILLNSVRERRDVLRREIENTGFWRKKDYLKPSSNITERYTTSSILLISRGLSYYSWVLEYLPKLRGLEIYSEKTGKKPQILIHRNADSWMEESIKYCINDSYDVQRVDHQGVAHIDELVVTSHRVHDVSGYKTREGFKNYNPHHPSDYQWLRDSVIENTTTDFESERIYISREDASYRRVINEDEIIEDLSERGFKICKFAEMSFREQVRSVADAEMIVGPHGAGFVNMVFSKEPVIVEIVPSAFQKPSIYALSRILGYDYDYVIAEATEPNLDAMYDWGEVAGTRDVRVDTTELMGVIDKYIDEGDPDTTYEN